MKVAPTVAGIAPRSGGEEHERAGYPSRAAFQGGALLSRPGHGGERIAAQAAVARIGARLAELTLEEPMSDLLFSPSAFWTHNMLTAVEIQRLAAYSLFNSNVAWTRTAASFMRASFWPRGEAVARFWYGEEPEK